VFGYLAHALPPKFRLSNGNRNLTIVSVCKNCGSEKSDLQVIQCNASNAHGYAFAAGYINVLCKIFLFICFPSASLMTAEVVRLLLLPAWSE
jgi:hypothetical protein